MNVDASFTSLSANAYSFNIDKANSKIAKKLAHDQEKCDGKVLNINSNSKHQKKNRYHDSRRISS